MSAVASEAVAVAMVQLGGGGEGGGGGWGRLGQQVRVPDDRCYAMLCQGAQPRRG